MTCFQIIVTHMQQSLTALIVVLGLCSFSMRSNIRLVSPMYTLGHTAQGILYIALALSCGGNRFYLVYDVQCTVKFTSTDCIEVKMSGFYNKLVKLVFVKTFKSSNN